MQPSLIYISCFQASHIHIFGPEIEEEMKNLKKIHNTIYCIAQGYILEKILQTEHNNSNKNAPHTNNFN